MLPEDFERMAKFLGRDKPAVRRLLKAAMRDPNMMDTVRTLLKRRCITAGFDPDDPPPFSPVRELPPGSLTLGRVLQGQSLGPEFSLTQELLCQHVGVLGSNGTGKSFLAMHLAAEAIRGNLRVWILDIEDEYSRLIQLLPEGALTVVEPEHLRLNFIQPPGPWVSPASWVGELNLLLRGGTFLRDGSLNVFHTGMARLLEKRKTPAGGEDWPSLLDVIEHFRGMGFGPKSRNVGFVESLLNRLEMLSEAFASTCRVNSSDMLTTLATRSVIFRLHRMTGVSLQFLVGFLLLWLARYREGAADAATHVVIVEEAHMLASEKSRQDIGESILCRMFRTARKRKVALVLCDQVPSELPSAILGNLGCRIVMRLVNARCIWSIQSSMGLQRPQADAIPELQRRQAIVQYPMRPETFMIQVPELEFPNRPDEALLRSRAESLLSTCTWKELSAPAGQVAKPPATAAAPGDLAGDTMLVMVRICEQPAEPIDQRVQVLRMDRSREFRARGELDARGLIAEAEQAIGGKIKFFRPTDKGLAWAQQHRVHVKKFKSGIVHEYLLSQVERCIGLISPKWRLQRNSSIARDQGLQPDLLAMGPEGQRIVAEICCNNLDYDAENILVESGIPEVDKVVVVTPDRRTGQDMQAALRKASGASGEGWQAKVVLLDASQCLAPKFDWAALVAKTKAPG